MDICKSQKEFPCYNAYRDIFPDFNSITKWAVNLKLIVLTTSLLVILSCNQNRKFDNSAWREKGDLGTFPNREEMLKDLMNNHQLKGLTYKQLMELLGKPENDSDAEPNVACYNIVTDYGRDIDPVYIKNLQVKFNADSIVTEVAISEIKH